MANLRGFGNPLSPSGEAALVDDPPHHISADALHVVFRVDPERAAPYLPDGLALTDDALGYAYIADMVKVSEQHPDQPHLDPRRTQYQEGIVGLYCHHDGVPGRFSAFIWVTEDWSVVFGHYMGFAKKQAEVHRTKIQPANPAMGPVGPGTRLAGTVDRMGARVLSVGLELTERLADDGVPSYGHRVYTYRHIPSPSPDVPDLRQLFAVELDEARTLDAWRATGSVVLNDVAGEDLGGLQPREVVDAFAYQRGWTTKTGARLLAQHDA